MQEPYIIMEISRTHNLLRRHSGTADIRREMKETTGKNGWIIGFLVEHQGEDIFQKDIENRFSIRRSTVSNMLGLMEKKGYVRRVSVESDARLKKLVPTQKALDIHRKMMEALERKEQSLREGITQEDLDTFFRVLDKIQHNIGQTE